jgi:hypothetical protein
MSAPLPTADKVNAMYLCEGYQASLVVWIHIKTVCLSTECHNHYLEAAVFWVVTTYSAAVGYRRFEDLSAFIFNLKMTST